MKTLPEIMLDPNGLENIENVLEDILEDYKSYSIVLADKYHFDQPTRTKILNNALANMLTVHTLIKALRIEHDKIHS